MGCIPSLLQRVAVASSLFLLAFLPMGLYAQNTDTVDSLQQILSTDLPKQEEADTYIRLAQAYMKSDSAGCLQALAKATAISQEIGYSKGLIDAYFQHGLFAKSKDRYAQAKLQFEKALELAQTQGDTQTEASALEQIGYMEYRQDRYDEAISFYDQSIIGYQKIGDQTGIARIYNHKGVSAYRKGDYPKAIEFHHQSLKIKESIGDRSGMAMSYGNLGNISKKQGNTVKAIEYYLDGFKIFEELDIKWAIAAINNNIGEIYQSQEKYDQALHYYEKSLEAREALGQKRAIAESYHNIAGIYLAQGLYEKSIEYNEQSLAIKTELNNSSGMASSLNDMGKAQLALGHTQQSIENSSKALKLWTKGGNKADITHALITLGNALLSIENYPKALESFKNALALAEEVKYKDSIREATEALAQVYAAMGKYQQAYSYHVKFKALSDSLLSERNIQQLTQRTMQYEFDKEKTDIQAENEQQQLIQQQSIERRNLIIGSTGGIIFLLLAFSVIIFRNYKAKQRANALLATQNGEIKQQREEILAQNEELQQQAEEIITQRDHIEEQNKTLIHINQAVNQQKEAAEKAYKNISTLSQIGRDITASLDLQAITKIVYQHVNELMPAEAFGVGVYDEKNEIISFEGFIEKGESLPAHYDKANDPNALSAQCLNSGNTIVINDFEREHTQYIQQIPDVIEGEVPASVIYMPLILENKAVGVITVQSFEPHAYSDSDTIILNTLASYAAIAVANAYSYEIIEQKNEHITASIRYAQTIQQAILPSFSSFQKAFDDCFLIYLPKDIVSGDFYWYAEAESGSGLRHQFIAVADCTGHGVPGAFMSMIGHTLLNEIISIKDIHDPAQVLEELDESIKTALNQENQENTDGMDIALCRIDRQPSGDVDLYFAGAKRPLHWYENSSGELHQIPGARRSIGGLNSKDKVFETHHMRLATGDILYMQSDGLADQKTTERHKIGSAAIVKTLHSNCQLPMEQQKEALLSLLDNAQGTSKQRDDITLLSIKI